MPIPGWYEQMSKICRARANLNLFISVLCVDLLLLDATNIKHGRKMASSAVVLSPRARGPTGARLPAATTGRFAAEVGKIGSAILLPFALSTSDRWSSILPLATLPMPSHISHRLIGGPKLRLKTWDPTPLIYLDLPRNPERKDRKDKNQHDMVKPGQVTLSQQEIGWTPSANATAGVQIAAVQWRQLVPGINWISLDISGYRQKSSFDTICRYNLDWWIGMPAILHQFLCRVTSTEEKLTRMTPIGIQVVMCWAPEVTRWLSHPNMSQLRVLQRTNAWFVYLKHFKTNKQQKRLLFPQSLWYPWPNPR